MSKVRSIAIQGQKLGTNDMFVAYKEKPDRFHSEIGAPFGQLVFQLMVEKGLRAGKSRKGFVAAYHAAVSELRQLQSSVTREERLD